jgi:hypothetical protein
MSVTPTLDPRFGVGAEELATWLITTALLAHVRAGTLRMELDAGLAGLPGGLPGVRVVPTGLASTWPSATLEARLATERAARVSDLVYDWIGENSLVPGARVVELAKVLAVVRGHASVSRDVSAALTVSPVQDRVAQVADAAILDARGLSDEARASQPDLLRALHAEIALALRRRRRTGGDGVGPDVWAGESQEDRARFLPPMADASQHPVFSALVTTPLLLILWYGIFFSGLDERARAVGVVVLCAVAFFALPWGPAVRARASVASAFQRWGPTLPATPPPRPQSWLARTWWELGLGVPLLTLVLYVVLFGGLQVWFTLATAVAVFVVWPKLQRNAGGAILDRVTAAPSSAAAGVAPIAPVVEHADDPLAALPTPSMLPLPTLQVEITHARALPPVSDVVATRLEEVRERRVALRRLHLRATVALAVVTVALLLAPGWIAAARCALQGGARCGDVVPDISGPIAGALALALTATLLHPKSFAWVRAGVIGTLLGLVFGGAASVKRDASDSDTLFPWRHALLGAAWAAVAVLGGVARTFYGDPGAWLAGVATLAAAVAWAVSVRVAGRALERRLPPHAPLNLLALRVFRSDHLPHFLAVADAWRWVGTMRRLDGPDTAGSRATDIVNYLVGRVEDSVVEDAAELEATLRSFHDLPDRDLRFALQSMQCNDATWRDALERLLVGCDVVVLDLAGLSAENQGVAWEVGRLVDAVPWERVVLLVDDTTDLGVLTDLVACAWAARAPSSPNADREPPVVRVLHDGGTEARGPDESLTAWRARQERRLQSAQLVDVLYRAALPSRRPADDNERVLAAAAPWSRIPGGAPARFLFGAMGLALMFTAALGLLCSGLMTPSGP